MADRHQEGLRLTAAGLPEAEPVRSSEAAARPAAGTPAGLAAGIRPVAVPVRSADIRPGLPDCPT